MEQMLVAAKERGPYVLVSHSLGSTDVQLFADVYRRKVAGMVLVDPAMVPEGLKVAPRLPAQYRSAGSWAAAASCGPVRLRTIFAWSARHPICRPTWSNASLRSA